MFQSTSRQRSLAIVLGLATFLRLMLLVVAWHHDQAAFGLDTGHYWINAESLAHGGTFRNDGGPELARTPGYPLFLIFCGFKGPLGYGIVQIAQILFDVFAVYLTYLLGKRLINLQVGLLASALHAVSVVAIVGSVKILTDSLFSSLLLLSIYLLVRHFQEQQGWLLALSALVAVTATYVRPVGLLFLPIVLLVLAFQPRRLVRIPLFGLIFATLLAPWFIRNYSLGYHGFTSLGSHDLLYLEAAGAKAYSEHIPLEQARQELADEYKRQLQARHINWFSIEALEFESQMANAKIWSHPLLCAYLHVVQSGGSFLPESWNVLQMMGITKGGRHTLDVLQTKGLFAATRYYFGSNILAAFLVTPEVLILFAAYLGCLYFGYLQLKQRHFHWEPAGWLIVLTVFSFILVAGAGAQPRFRMPVDPLLSLGGAGGMVPFFRRFKSSSGESKRLSYLAVTVNE